MFKMSAFSIDGRCELFANYAKAQNRFSVCFIITPFSLTGTAIFGSTTFCDFGFSLLKLTKIIYYYHICT